MPAEQDGDDDSSVSSQSSSQNQQQRAASQLPPLAPRESSDPSIRHHRSSTSTSASGRPARLSHRSRAGCWTCRGRKVKCDEIHPRCGPCQRLNRECDWDLRWNFSDATSSTQGKYKNVSTVGSAVWDSNTRTSPSHSPLARHYDHLPPFASLSNDQEREAKAETQRPGTYSVVVTPESFSDLPEYSSVTSSGSRRMSIHSNQTCSVGSPVEPFSRSSSRNDPNIVILDKFEDVSSAPPSSLPFRRPNYVDEVPRPSLSAVPSTTPLFIPTTQGQRPGSNDPLVEHFRRNIVRRFVQPLWDSGTSDVLTPGSTRDSFELEAARSPALYHAICAISTLHLSYLGQSSFEDALQYYHQAVSSATTPTTPDDLLSNGLFLRHFLLFLYDICAPRSVEIDDGDMWAMHLNRLSQIALQRHLRLGGGAQLGYMLWTTCELDMYACLLGSGNCSFIATVLQHNMLPALDQQVPELGFRAGSSLSETGFLPGDEQLLIPVLQLRQGMVIQTAKMAQIARTLRLEASASSRGHLSGAMYARRQSVVDQVSGEIHAHWDQAYPEYLPRDVPQAGFHLPNRVRYVYEHALLLYHAAMIYSRTSMFPGQRQDPYFAQASALADVENRCSMIIGLVAAILASDATTNHQDAHDHKRHVVFPVFLAGVATAQPDLKIQAIDLIRSMEGTVHPSTSGPAGFGGMATSMGGGIGQNTHRTRQLLVAVCEEQRRVGRMESVEWLDVARERGLTTVNCGL